MSKRTFLIPSARKRGSLNIARLLSPIPTRGRRLTVPVRLAEELLSELAEAVVTVGVNAASNAATVNAKSRAMTAALTTNNLARTCPPFSSISSHALMSSPGGCVRYGCPSHR